MQDSYLEDLMGDINATTRDKELLVKIPDNGKVQLAFLSDVPDVMKVVIHGRYVKGSIEKGYTIPCPAMYGKKCPFCALPNTKQNMRSTTPFYGWLVYDTRDSKQKIFLAKANPNGPLKPLSDIYANFDTIVGFDIIISKSGENYTTKYSASNLPPTKSTPKDRLPKVPTQRAEIHKLVLEYAAKAHYPDLLRNGELTFTASMLTEEITEAERAENENESENKPLFGGALNKVQEAPDELLPKGVDDDLLG